MVNKTDPKTKRKKIHYLFLTEVLFFSFFSKVFSLLIWLFKPAGAFQGSDLDSGGSRTRRDMYCRDDLEYLNGYICCLNCPAGKTHGATLD